MPREIDLRGTNWDGSTSRARGIYKLDGDLLTLCLSFGNEARPPDRPVLFDEQPGTRLFNFRRGNPGEGEFTRYPMPTEASTIASRSFRDEQGRLAVTIYYTDGP